MNRERLHLLGGPARRQADEWRTKVLFVLNIVSLLTTKSIFALLLSGVLTAAQFLLLPRILEQVPAKFGLLIGYGVSTILDLIVNGIWILITVDLEAGFHSGLIGTKLNKVQRDALRKCDSLDGIIRICITKLPVVVVSLVWVFKPIIGIL